MSNLDIRQPDESPHHSHPPKPVPVLDGWDGGNYVHSGPVAPEDEYGQFLLAYQERLAAAQKGTDEAGYPKP